MHHGKIILTGWLILVLFAGAMASPAFAQQKKNTPPPAPAAAPLPAAPSPAKAQETGKPNIVIIWGDDIGQSNISAYTNGLMGYRTPNIDSVAHEGMIFTDYYGEQSCTAGRSAFITGQSVFRTGLSKVGLPGADHRPAQGGSDHRRTAEGRRATRPASSARTIWATRTSSCRPRMASTNSTAISITSTPRRSRSFPIIRSPTIRSFRTSARILARAA